MLRWRCPREPDTARAAGAGEWPEELRAHAADCPVCRDVALVAGALGHERRRLPADPPGLCAGRLWWMAQLRTRRAAAERALRPISVMTMVAVAAVVPVAASALASALPTISSWLTELHVVSAVGEIIVRGTLPGLAVAGSAALALLLFAIAHAVTGADG